MDYNTFAKNWIKAWNSHNLTEILDHYASDITITTPMIRKAADIDQDSLSGKGAVGIYWQKALENIPDLHFELLDVLEGVDSVALYYNSVLNKRAVEVMHFNSKGKVTRMIAYYT